MIVFLDTYINLAKYLQRVPLEVSINWHYLHQDAGETYSEISNMRSYWKYSKATICGHMKKNIGDLVVTKGIPSSITGRQFVQFCKRLTNLKWIYFRRKGILTKTDLKLRLLSLLKKFVVNVQCNSKIWNHQKAYGKRESRS